MRLHTFITLLSWQWSLGLLCWMGAMPVIANEPSTATVASRPLWTTSRVQGSPEPALPYRSRRAFPQLSFEKPRGVRCEPTSGRLLVVERERVLAFSNDESVTKADVFLDSPDHDVYSLAFHPRYEENGYVYVFTNDGFHPIEPKYNRIFRYQTKGTSRACDPASRTVVLEWPSIGHDGGDLAFGPDAMLYIGSGDGTVDFDSNHTGQDISDLTSGILRIDVDRTEGDKLYAIPTDNPFLNRAGARPELWAYGLRNPWRISFDPPTGRLWVGEIGQDRWDMIHWARAGHNYGWSVFEGTHPFQPSRKLGADPVTPPIVEHSHAEARSIIGGFVYHGKRFPELQGAYLYGDWETGNVWGLRFDGERVTWQAELADTTCRILGFGVDAEGELFFADNGGAQICTLEVMPSTEPTPDFPRKLSESGIFTDVASHQPQAGLVAYSVNSPLWSDGASKVRLLGVPGDGRVEFSADQPWQFPEGTVFVKTFALPVAGDTSKERRVETRLFTKQRGDWVGYSYKWNDDQSDAELVAKGGADHIYQVADAEAATGLRRQTWHFPSRAECMMCHTSAAGFVLGFSLNQLNRPCESDQTLNQLDWLAEQQVFRFPGEKQRQLPQKWTEYPALADPRNMSASVNDRARSYLHANCSHCHMLNGGGNALMDVRVTSDEPTLRLWDVRPEHSPFGIAEARLLSPGQPERSVLLHRMSTEKLGRMPPLGSSIVDRKAVELLTQWVRETKHAPPAAAPTNVGVKP